MAELLLRLTDCSKEIIYKEYNATFVKIELMSKKVSADTIDYSIELEEGLKKLINWRKNHKINFK